MALKSQFTKFGYTFPEAYTRISSYSGDNVTTTFTTETYTCQAARETNETPIASASYQVAYDADLLASCYVALKLEPLFIGSTDC